MSLPDCPPLPADFLPLLEQLTSIGAPTGDESRRADFIHRWFEDLRPGSATVDGIFNVTVDLSAGAERVWLIDAHTDIVFDDLELTIRKDGPIWRCPGIIDDTACCVFLMLLGRELLSLGKPLPLIITFSVGEEGQGDLVGIRTLGERLKPRLAGSWLLDLNLDAVTRAAVGSRRWRVKWTAPGGHSWGNFGEPSAIHALGRWIHELATAAKWEKRQLSYNVGRIDGGTTVNAIAENASCLLDLRSVDPSMLDATAESVQKIASKVAVAHSVDVHFEPIGFRPAGVVPDQPPLVQMVEKIQHDLDLPCTTVVNSTNANALLALDIPATCTGLVRGGGVHTREEWLDTQPLPVGWKKVWALARTGMQAARALQSPTGR